jgi:hypothetical protein
VWETYPSYKNLSRPSNSATVTSGRTMGLSSQSPSGPSCVGGHTNIVRNTSDSRCRKKRCTRNNTPSTYQITMAFKVKFQKCRNLDHLPGRQIIHPANKTRSVSVEKKQTAASQRTRQCFLRTRSGLRQLMAGRGVQEVLCSPPATVKTGKQVS